MTTAHENARREAIYERLHDLSLQELHQALEEIGYVEMFTFEETVRDWIVDLIADRTEVLA